MFEAEQILSRMTGPAVTPGAKIVLFTKKEVLLKPGENGWELPAAADFAELIPDEGTSLNVGSYRGAACHGAELRCMPESLPDGIEKVNVRAALAGGSGDLWSAVCRARELVFWRNLHRYCGGCRTELESSDRDQALICPQCGARYYPQIAPAVIVAISRHEGKEILLAHNRNFEFGIYGLIAGFVEAGETAEQAVSREIMEETGIEVKNVRYLTSQTWPFPNSLMLAYAAEYAGGTARADGMELTDLGWFDAEHLPQLPPSGSVARSVINRFFNFR